MPEPTNTSSTLGEVAQVAGDVAAIAAGPVGVKISAAIDLLTSLIASAQKISALIQEANAAGSATLSATAWATIVGADDSAEVALTAAIAAAKAAGK